MNSWNQPQQLQQNNNNNNIMGQAQFNPYNTNLWGQYQYNQPQRLPVYHAEPIHGENAAWQFPMGPNSEIYLPDADEDIIWWIRTDANGNRNVLCFDAILREKKPPVDTNDLAARLAAVEEWINGKQNKSNTKRNTTTVSNIADSATTT